MKKLLEILAFVAILLLGSCEEYDHVIADHDDRLDQLEESFITSVKQQMTAIDNSLKNLETVDKALDGYIKALETQAAELQKQLDENLAADASDKKALEDEILAINVLLEELKAKDAELDKKIDDLKKYLGGEIDATKDWAETTFATLEQYSALQTEISAIKTLMEGYGDEISADLEESIDTLEKSMKYWVNAALAEGYYDMAEIDAKLAAVKSELADADKELLKQLEDQLAAFEQAKNDLIKAYADAISEAIETNNGVISKIIADELQKAMDKVDSRLADIENDIAAIWRDIENVKSDIASIEQQIKGINSSIADLKAVDVALKVLIDNLTSEAVELQAQLDKNAEADADTKKALQDEIDSLLSLIKALQTNDAELDKKIADLKKYTDEQIGGTEDWAESTFATLEQYSLLQTEVATIAALLEQHKSEHSDVSDGAITDAIAEIEDAIETLEVSMKTWVNEVLAEGYYDISAVDAKLAALETKLSNADANIVKAIKDQQAALEQAKKELTEAYTAAIKDAIEKNNGVITAAISASVQTALVEVNSQLEDIKREINLIKAQITSINSNIASIKQQIEAITASIDELEGVDDALKTLIDNLTSEAEDLQSQLDDNAAADLETKNALQTEIENINALVAALKTKDVELDQKITDLKAYLDNEIGATEDWANETFATLTQYSAMQTELATLKALIETYKTDITAAYTEAIKNAISTSEASMKAWVNEVLAAGYYNIAAIDAKLSALEQKLSDADVDLADELEAQQAALEQAKTDLTKAYEKTIKEAIEKNSGKITEDIADAVKAAEERLEAKITSINAEIESIKDLIESLKETVNDLVARIQSMRFIPEYSDGKVAFGLGASTAELTFMISPNDAAAKVASAWTSSNDVVTAFIKPTQPRTKASDALQSLNVLNVISDANGILVVTISADNVSNDFWYEGMEANVFVCISDGNNDIVSEMIPIYYVGTPYVTFKASAAQTLKIDTDVDRLQFSTDKGATWHSLTTSTDNATFGPDNDLLLRGINSGGTGNATISFTNSSVPVACSGDIRTLVDYSNYAKVNTSSAKFTYLFSNCKVLTSAPALPATTLARACYSNMFNGCTGLTKAPSLPATQLAEYCYNAMFYGCTSLMEAPELPATDLAESCYLNMFSGCILLTSAPALPAETLAEFCYYGMFMDCTSLTSAPELPAETLAKSCYDGMFIGCTSLTSAPVLPAKTLAESCYYGMFMRCTSLTSAPELPAETLAVSCYSEMFKFCEKLSNIKMLATDVTATRCLHEWVKYVASTGTFTKVAEATLTTGISGIPDGWTVIQEASKGVDAPDFGFGASFSN